VLERGLEAQLRRAHLRALDGSSDEIVQLDSLEAELALLAACQLDEIRNEARHGSELDRCLGERALRFVRGQFPLAEQVDVRAD